MQRSSYSSFLTYLVRELVSRNSRNGTCFHVKSYVSLHIVVYAIELEWPISSGDFALTFPHKASFKTINLAHPNGSFTVNAIAQRHSAFRSLGGFSRDDELPKSVWLSTLAFFPFFSYVLISFPPLFRSCVRLSTLSSIRNQKPC